MLTIEEIEWAFGVDPYPARKAREANDTEITTYTDGRYAMKRRHFLDAVNSIRKALGESE